MVATRNAGQPSPKKLKFHEKLVGKGLTTDALQKKLKALHTELADMDQELVDVASLSSVRKELINTTLLLHKDRGVKAYTACCLADLLRLYAPDAPYTQNELRDIFQFFFRQLSTGLKGSESPYYNEYFHLLESLSTVKSVVLICDLPNADELMVDVFREFFGMIRRDLAKKIELFMADIIIALIDECQSLPSDVLEIIMSQFMDKNTRMDQPAYRLAVTVCNATADKLQRHVCQYFTDIIVQHSRDEEFEEVRKAHDLIKRLNRSCPALLHNVVPQLEEELRVEEVQIRIMAVQVLGEMFADKNGADFVKKYPTTWNLWLFKKNDKAVAVRLALVEAARSVLVGVPETREAIEDALSTKILDPDEKVRAAVCKLYYQLDYETALHHVSLQQLRAVAGRGLDKKHSVRVEAINAIGRLYSLAYPEIENNDPAAIKQFAWIPETILHMVATSPGEVKPIAEQVLADFVFPLPSPASSSTLKSTDIDEIAWTDRLLFIMRYLDKSAVNSLLGLSGIKLSRPSNYDRYLQACIDFNGGIMDDNEEAITDQLTASIKRLAVSYPDQQKAVEDLRAFANLNEARLYKLLKTCLDTQVDLKSLVKATNEFLKRLEQSSSSLVPTMTVFLRRGSLRIVNQSSIPTFIKRVQKGDTSGASDDSGNSYAHLSAQNAQTWMSLISKHCPAIHKLHVGELSKAIAEEKNPRLVEVCLQALAAVTISDAKSAPADKRTIERAMKYVMRSHARQSKFAARLLAYSKDRDELCNEVVESIANGLPDAEPELLVAHITVLKEFALRAPDAFEQQSEAITAFLLRQVLLKSNSDAMETDEVETDEEWIEEDDMPPELAAKILALKVLRNRCLAHASSEAALDVAKPVIKMFATLLACNGSFSSDADDQLRPPTKARLRLQASISMLHLCSVEVYAKALTHAFVNLAVMIQDPCFQVRLTFLNKLIALLTARKLPVHFNIIPFLTVHDPEAEPKNMAKYYILLASRSMPKSMKFASLELTFIRLLHLLAHHPDFAITEESLAEIAKYLEFYISLIASAENISLLYHLAMKAKTVRDAESHAYSENLYAASELAQYLIKAYAKAHGWSLESYPGKVKLPADILRPLPNAKAANEVLKTTYLPENTLAWLSDQAKSKNPQESKGDNKQPAKRKAAPKANGQTKRSRTAKRRKAAEEDEEDEPSEATEDEDEDADDDDVEESLAMREPEVSDTEEDEAADEPQEEKLGRGARTLAKARIKKQAKQAAKRKAKALSSG